MSEGMLEGMSEEMFEEMFERSRRVEGWPDVFPQKCQPGVVVFCSPRPVSE